MPVSKSSAAKKFLGFTFKLLGTALLWIGTAILTKLQLAPNAKDWQATLQQLPLWVLVVLIILFPIAWLLVEFVATCLIEVRARVLERTAPRFAQWLTEVPTAGLAVLGRWADSCLACLGRWRFDGRYRARIAEECEQLHTQTGLLHATAGFSLEEVYTELNMASTQYGEIDRNLLSSSIRGRESIYGFLRMQRPGTALAILGRPGGGKTTLLRHLALLYARSKQGQHRLRRRIPIVIELRRVTDLFTDKAGSAWKSPTLIQVIRHYWKQHSALGDLMAKAPGDWLKRHLAGGRVLVMVDGLDEVPHGSNLAKPVVSPRQRVSQWMEDEMQREGQRDCLFLITSRPGGFAEAPLKNRVSVVEVQPLTLEQSERFIYAFQLGCQRKARPTANALQLQSNAARATEKLQQELRSKPHLSDLRVNPLLLHMVCLLHHLRGRLPADRSDLYKETCDVLLKRDLRAPGILERLRPEDKLAALRPLAAYFMRSGSPEAKSTDELLHVIQPVFNTLNFSAKDFFDYIVEDSGLLQEAEHGRWDFAHKTFYEYLTAEHWQRHPPAADELAEWVEQDWWRVTLLFYSANSEDSPVISAALASSTPKAWSLAFACLTAGHRINACERNKANSQLDRALSNPSDEHSFNPAAQALLDLRMRETVSASLDGKWLRRNTFVTQAEYQLFLLSRAASERWIFVPPHWTSDCFSGDPTAPMLGVTSYQAMGFAKWATNSGEQAWQLPTSQIGSADLPDGCWVVDDEPQIAKIKNRTAKIKDAIAQWAKANGLTAIPDHPWEQLLEPSWFYRRRTAFQRMVIVTRAFLGRVASGLSSIGRPTDDNKRIIGARASLEINLAFEIAQVGVPFDIRTYRYHEYLDESLNGYLRYYKHLLPSGRDAFYLTRLGTALYLALNLGQDVALKEAFTYAFNGKKRPRPTPGGRDDSETLGDFCKSVPIALAISGRYDNLASALSEDSLDIGQIDRLINELDELYSTDDFIANRLRLLVSAAKVVVTQSNPISHRHAWLRYGMCLAQLCFQRQIPSDRQFIPKVHFALKLLEARAEGRVEPWEGILLVRQV